MGSAFDRWMVTQKKKVKESIEVGDTIMCSDADEMIDIDTALQNDGFETDYMYEKDGVKGLWIKIIKTRK